jgi:glutathione S-transferase
MADKLVFYHNPMSRGRIVHWMLEEVGAPYETKPIDLKKREQKAPAYLAINPMGKIPTIVHGDTVVTETAAICAYLADAFPRAGLAPPLGDHARGTYYRWLFFGASCVEPALFDKAMGRPPVEREGMLAYGNYESVLGALEKALEPGPWILGERFSAADVYVGAQVGWGLSMKSLEPRPAFQQYGERCAQRPAFKRTQA